MGSYFWLSSTLVLKGRFAFDFLNKGTATGHSTIPYAKSCPHSFHNTKVILSHGTIAFLCSFIYIYSEQKCN